MGILVPLSGSGIEYTERRATTATAQPVSRGLYWALTDLRCNTIATFDQRAPGSQVAWPLADARRATLRLSLEDSAAHRVAPLKTALYCELDGTPIFHGPCLTPQLRGREGILEVPAVDAAEWLARGFFHAADTHTAVEQATIMAAVVAGRTSDLDAAGVYLRRVIEGTIAATGVARTITYEPGTNRWQPLLDMKMLLDGPEFELEPLPPDATYSGNAAWARLNVATRLGTDRSKTVRFEFAHGQDNAADLVDMPDGAAVGNYVNVRGQTESGGTQPTGFAQQSASRAEYGTWEKWENVSHTTNALCAAHAAQQAAAYGLPPDAFIVTPAMEGERTADGRPYGIPPTFLTDYFVGDTLTAAGLLGLTKVERVGRLVQATITEADSAGNVRVDLACVPRVTAQGVST